MQDFVYVDPPTGAIAANLSTTTLGSSLPLLGSWMSEGNISFFEGILFNYNSRNMPSLLEGVDHIVVVPVTNPNEAKDIAVALNHPRIKAGIMYPVGPYINYGTLSILAVRTQLTYIIIENDLGVNIRDQIEYFQAGPAADAMAGTNASSTNTVGRDVEDAYYHRTWARMYRSGYRKDPATGSATINTILVVAVTVPLVSLTLFGVFLYVFIRQRRLRRAKLQVQKQAREERRQMRVQALLATSIKPKNAPPLNDGQLRQLPLVSYDEQARVDYRFCTEHAINRFRVAQVAMATSSDEDTGGEDNDDDIEVAGFGEEKEAAIRTSPSFVTTFSSEFPYNPDAMPLLARTAGDLGVGDIHRYVLRVDFRGTSVEHLPLTVLIRNSSPIFKNLAAARGPFAISATVEKRPPMSFATPRSASPCVELESSPGLEPVPPTVGSATDYDTSPATRPVAHTCLFLICGQGWPTRFHLDASRGEAESVVDIEVVSEVNHGEARVQYEILVLAGKATLFRPNPVPLPETSEPPPTTAWNSTQRRATALHRRQSVSDPLLPDTVHYLANSLHVAGLPDPTLPDGRRRRCSLPGTHLASPRLADDSYLSKTDSAHLSTATVDHHQVTAELALAQTTADIFDDQSWAVYPSPWVDSAPQHLVVLSHGLMGSRLDELCLRERLLRHSRERQSGYRVRVLSPACNHGLTADGVVVNGQRVAQAILSAVQWEAHRDDYIQLASRGQKLDADPSASAAADNPLGHRISLIGHSLGGLINYNCLEHLDRLTDGHFFKVFVPYNFITLATPYVGITENLAIVGRACQWGIMGQTGKDLAYLGQSDPLALLSVAQRISTALGEPGADTLNSKLAPAPDLPLITPDEEQVRSQGTTSAAKPGPWFKLPWGAAASDGAKDDGQRDPTTVSDDILWRMAQPDGPWLVHLRQFQHRTAYANVDNDVSVGFYTASLVFSDFDRAAFLRRSGLSLVSKVQQNSRLLWDRSVTHDQSLLRYDQPTGTRSEHRVAGLSEDSCGYPLLTTEEGGAKADTVPQPTLAKQTSTHDCTLADAPTTSVFQAGFHSLRKMMGPWTAGPSEQSSASADPNHACESTFVAATAASTPAHHTELNGSHRHPIVHDEIVTPDAMRERFGSHLDQFHALAPPAWIPDVALAYHGPGLTWRKVHTHFTHDAHNQIIARRRFYQVSGQPVMDHLLSHHPF
ncbi:hypothetical protein IWQ60_009997 [Tieghemiomyces parasiticus]|uniref:DUF676 domain-containing protein n=1 Tax=Tieghemiomyces parasiticus TaxID=78921 RepID=A0A9W8DJ17_9FUNG|nr:hypothetical protein IWQ60_009997 [Tieghemiomyces parasiticus]